MTPPFRLTDVYETAAHVRQVLARFAATHGAEPLEQIVPEISAIFERLERLLSENSTDKSREYEKELEHVLGKIESVRNDRIYLGERFDNDFNSVIQQWRRETGPLELNILQLKEEITKLTIRLQNRYWAIQQCQMQTDAGRLCGDEEETSYRDIMAVMSDIKEEIHRKDIALKEAHEELDMGLLQIQKAVTALHLIKEDHDKLLLNEQVPLDRAGKDMNGGS